MFSNLFENTTLDNLSRLVHECANPNTNMNLERLEYTHSRHTCPILHIFCSAAPYSCPNDFPFSEETTKHQSRYSDAFPIRISVSKYQTSNPLCRTIFQSSERLPYSLVERPFGARYHYNCTLTIMIIGFPLNTSRISTSKSSDSLDKSPIVPP